MKGDILSFHMRLRSMICSKKLQRYGMRIRPSESTLVELNERDFSSESQLNRRQTVVKFRICPDKTKSTGRWRRILQRAAAIETT